MAGNEHSAPITIQAGRGRTERGAILFLTAIAMIGLLAFTSLAVDMGMIRSKRSVYQHAADTSTLAGAYLLNQLKGTFDPSDSGPLADTYLVQVSDRIKAAVQSNLGITPSQWANCTDPARLAERASTDIGISNQCISFITHPKPLGVRVRLPGLNVTHFFGLGSTTITAAAGTESASGGPCDPAVDIGCYFIATTTTVATTTTRPPTTTTRATTTTAGVTTTTRPPTTTTRPTTTTTRSGSATTTTTRPPTTTTRPPTTTTRSAVTTTTRPPTTTTRPPTTTTRPPTTTTRRPTTTTLLDLSS
jgi:hypothetical protein